MLHFLIGLGILAVLLSFPAGRIVVGGTLLLGVLFLAFIFFGPLSGSQQRQPPPAPPKPAAEAAPAARRRVLHQSAAAASITDGRGAVDTARPAVRSGN